MIECSDLEVIPDRFYGGYTGSKITIQNNFYIKGDNIMNDSGKTSAMKATFQAYPELTERDIKRQLIYCKNPLERKMLNQKLNMLKFNKGRHNTK